jgi:hypothetical protein
MRISTGEKDGDQAQRSAGEPMRRFDVDRSGLAGISPAIEVAAGHDMRVVEAEARRFRHVSDPSHPMRRNEGRAFLCGTVDLAGNHLAVPMDHFRRIGVLVHIDHDALTFLELEPWPRKLAVVEGGRDDVLG